MQGRVEAQPGRLQRPVQVIWGFNDRTAVIERGKKKDKKAPQKSAEEIAAQSKLLKDNVRKLDQTMAKLTKDVDTLTVKLADPALYAPDKKWDFTKLQKEQAAAKKKLAETEEEWIAATEALEALNAS